MRVGLVVGRVELAVAVERRAAVAPPAEHRLLLVDRHAVPEFDQHPDQPDYHVGPVGGPGRLGRVVHPDQVGRGRAGRVGGAVLEAEQVPRRAGRTRRRVVALHLPGQLHAAAGVLGDVPDRVVDRVRVVGAELQQQVAAEPGGLERVVGEGVIGVSLLGLTAGETVAVVEQRRADRQRRGQAVGRDHRAEHVAVRRRLADPEVGRGPAGGEEPGAGGDRLHQVGQLGLARRRRVERRDAGERLLLGRAGGEHPGLARAVERVRRLGHRPGGGGGRVRVGVGSPDQHAAGQRGAGRAGGGALEEVPAVDVHEEISWG